MNVMLRSTLTESFPNQVSCRIFYITFRKKSIHLSFHRCTHAFNRHVLDGSYGPSNEGIRTHKAWTPHILLGVGFMMYSQKLLFSLRCPLELFGLYRSLVCRICLGMYPWAPCRSRHHPRNQLVQRWLERMEKGKEEAVNICQEEVTISCLIFGSKCTVPLKIPKEFINRQDYLQRAS